MNHEQKNLFYDSLNHHWLLGSSSSSNAALPKTLYWGANQSPLAIKAGRSPFQSHRFISTRPILQYHGGRPYIGPLIGILTAKGASHPFSGMKANFVDIIAAGKRKGAIVFVFTSEGVRWNKEEIEGYLFHPAQKRWVKARFPFPNVIYNRISKRKYESQPLVQETLRRFQSKNNLTLYNPRFFNKKELFQQLEQSDQVSHYLPKTRSLHSMTDLREMLSHFSQLYLKPTQGKAGSGIMKVYKETATRGYRLVIPTQQQPKVIFASSFSTLWKQIKQHMIASPYIVQQGINLAKVDRCSFDFRVLVQKNHQGDWQVAGLGVRVAGLNRITTHVPRGGRIESPNKVLQQLYKKKEDVERIKDNVRQMAISIAQELEKHYSHLGEMSMDIGLDHQERLWFFEANSKPMKFDEPDIRRKSLDNIIVYAQHLTFQDQKGGSRSRALTHS